ncbi:MAG: hypothetical protein RIR62_3098 [Pseudomonadota bacterium]|jgi:hypothetical protein
MQTTYPAPSAATVTGRLGGILALPRRLADWLDDRGRGAWIAAMVFGFILFWPVGLFLVFYMTVTNRWSSKMFGQSCKSRRHDGTWGARRWDGRAFAPTGNSAFDAYRAETLRRLEEEQAAFESFLSRLREAKDKQEFDAFMEERARAPKAEPRDLPEQA